jgi:hypothetical protein
MMDLPRLRSPSILGEYQCHPDRGLQRIGAAVLVRVYGHRRSLFATRKQTANFEYA